MERTNQWLEQYLRIYGNFQQDDWARWLPMAQYVHNAWPSSTTGFTPFSLLLGFTPEITIPSSIKSPLPSLEQKGEFLKQLQDHAQEAIKHAQLITFRHNEKRHGTSKFIPFALGSKVWLDGTNLKLSHPSSKLAPRQYGPFTISKVISPVVYQLELPPSWKIFGTFHASLLSPYCETNEHGANFLEPPPEVIEGEEEYEVEQVLGQCTYGCWKKKQYLIKWKGYSAAHNSWEPAENVHAPELVKRYLDQSHAHARALVLKGEQNPGSQACPTDAALASLPLSSLTTPTLIASLMAYNKQKRAQAQTNNPGMTSRAHTRRARLGPRLSSSTGVIPHLSPPPPTPSPPPPSTPPLRVITVKEVSQPFYRRFRRKKTYGMRIWPTIHHSHTAIEIQRCCLSEPLPDMEAHQPCPLTWVISWVAPWGEVIQTTSDQVAHKEAHPPRQDWMDNYQAWRAALPGTPPLTSCRRLVSGGG